MDRRSAGTEGEGKTGGGEAGGEGEGEGDGRWEMEMEMERDREGVTERYCGVSPDGARCSVPQDAVSRVSRQWLGKGLTYAPCMIMVQVGCLGH